MRFHIRHWISLNRTQPHPLAVKENDGEWYVELTPQEVINLAMAFDVMVVYRPDHKCGDWHIDVDHHGKFFRRR